MTDHYDGKIGKYRNTGLVRWGYYMDHLLDYFFLASVIIGYAFILPERRVSVPVDAGDFCGLRLQHVLAFAATDKLKISYSEIRTDRIPAGANCHQHAADYLARAT